MTATATAVREVGQSATRRKSPEASRLLRDLVDLPVEVRRGFYRGLNERDVKAVLQIADREMGTPFGLWQDDPLGFVEDVLGERTWSIPKRLLDSIPHHDRIAVPSAFSTGKTWSVSRAVLWHANVWPVGTGQVVTIAAKFDQVRTIIWPEIRRAHKRAGLPGVTDVTQLKMATSQGQETVVAHGIGAAPHNETAVQGLHSPHLMLIVDEAGGIGMRVGRNLRALLTAEGTSMVAIGNPPTEGEGGWFETLCNEDDVLVLPISAMDTPNLTGEKTERCRSCPPEVPPHRLALHLASITAVRETIELHGADSSYVQAKVLARFPKGGPDRAIPSGWLEDAAQALTDDEVVHDLDVRLCDLGIPEIEEEDYVHPGSWIRLGVDVAADGGDELAISRIITPPWRGPDMAGDLAKIVHTSSGQTNTNVNDVAGKVLAQIRLAEKIRQRLGTEHKIRVKVDAIGIGWGVCGVLESWAEEGIHDAEIVRVVVSEGTYREADDATFRPANKRAEMWLALRSLVQPRDSRRPIRLRVDRKTLAQLGSPGMGTNSRGETTIEGKPSLKRRGLSSPDRGEAVLLGFYEPMLAPPKQGARLLVN